MYDLYVNLWNGKRTNPYTMCDKELIYEYAETIAKNGDDVKSVWIVDGLTGEILDEYKVEYERTKVVVKCTK